LQNEVYVGRSIVLADDPPSLPIHIGGNVPAAAEHDRETGGSDLKKNRTLGIDAGNPVVKSVCVFTGHISPGISL
jgi:hypothetical protein